MTKSYNLGSITIEKMKHEFTGTKGSKKELAGNIADKQAQYPITLTEAEGVSAESSPRSQSMADNEVEYLGTRTEVEYVKTNPSPVIYIKTELSAEVREILDSATWAQPKRQARRREKLKQNRSRHTPTRNNTSVVKDSEPTKTVKASNNGSRTRRSLNSYSAKQTSQSRRANEIKHTSSQPKQGHSRRPPPDVIDLITEDEDDVIMLS
ncbi:hypothetical protein BDZ89DRAFT_1043409 [Hymenopellis radicata]|nr:hypothetical protein BDZ89DRAFT_1043409 [Hymenopellis radicata]